MNVFFWKIICNIKMLNWNSPTSLYFYIISLYLFPYISVEEVSSIRQITNIPFLQFSDLGNINITLNKCCEPDQILNSVDICENRIFHKFDQNIFIGMIEKYVVDDNLEIAQINPARIFITYNYLNKGASKDDIIVTHWGLDEPASKVKYLFSQEDGSLIEINKKKNRTNHKFSTASYCLDHSYFDSSLIAYINPCLENLCIRKCCPKDQYYDTSRKYCVVDHQLSPIEVQFYFMNSVSEKNITHYLISGLPICYVPETIQIINSDINTPIYIQEDGYLVVVDGQTKNYIYYNNNRSYCIDMFSNATRKPYLNGLYCQKEYVFVRPAEIFMWTFLEEPISSTKEIPTIHTARERNRDIKSALSDHNLIEDKNDKPERLPEIDGCRKNIISITFCFILASIVVLF